MGTKLALGVSWAALLGSAALCAGACGKGSGEPGEAEAGTGGIPAALPSEGGSSGSGNAPAAAGMSASGGAGGAGEDDIYVPQNPACPSVSADGSSSLIDDAEDGDYGLPDPANEGRDGGWYAVGDASPGSELTFMPEPIAGGRGESESVIALHAVGSGMMNWGAVVAVELLSGILSANDEWSACAYDASAYDGVRFWVLGSGEQVRVKGTLMETMSTQAGGTCAAPNPDDCWNDHGVYLTFAEGWHQYTVPFADLAQQSGWGFPLEFDPSRLAAIRFQTDPGVDFDYWIDDIELYPTSNPPGGAGGAGGQGTGGEPGGAAPGGAGGAG